MARFDKFVLLFALSFLQIPQVLIYFGLPFSSGLTNAAFIGLMLVRLIVFVQKTSTGNSFRINAAIFRGTNRILVAYVLLLLIGAIRTVLSPEATSSSDSLSLFLYLSALIAICFNFFVFGESELSWARVVRFAAAGLLFYVTINFVLYLIIGSESTPANLEDSLENKTLGLLGISITRVMFPLAYGVNAFGPVAAAGLLSGVFLFRVTKGRYRALSFFGVISCIACMLLVDSRGAILAIAVSLIFSRYLRRKLGVFILLLTPMLPIIIVYASEVLLSDTVLSSVSRGDSGITSDRNIIWATALGELGNFKFQHLIGYGLPGNAESGVMSKYLWLFDWGTSEFRSLHNFMLQYIFDIGYIGATIFILMLIFVVRKLDIIGRDGKFRAEVLFIRSFVLFLCVQGGTEAIPTIYSRETFYLFFISMFAVFSWRPAAKTSTAPAVRGFVGQRFAMN